MVENCFLKHIPLIDGNFYLKLYIGTVILWFVFYIFGLTIIPFFLLKTICEYYEDDIIYVNV